MSPARWTVPTALAHRLSPATHATGYAAVLVWCKACHQVVADLEALIKAGRSGHAADQLRWRCGRCGSRLTDWVCTSRDAIAARPGFGHLALG